MSHNAPETVPHADLHDIRGIDPAGACSRVQQDRDSAPHTATRGYGILRIPLLRESLPRQIQSGHDPEQEYRAALPTTIRPHLNDK